jgi:acyl-CoA synthetase (AMP-forming)/AMP-acid ligase II
MDFPQIRHEVHYGGRVVRCFTERPATVDQAFREAVEAAPGRDALALGDLRITYCALDARVTAIAANLLALGLSRGERVGILLGNGVEFVETVLAAARAGLIAVPMNVRQRLPETEFVLDHCKAAALVHDAALAADVPGRDALPALRHVFVVGDGPGTAFDTLRRPAAATGFPEAAEEDTFCLLYTSGTTGRPKGAMLTHLGVIHSLIQYQHGLGLTSADVAVLAVPASHVTGLVAIILTMIRVAGTTAILPAFRARAFLDLAASEKMTYTLIVPAMYNLCLLERDFAAFDLAAWRIAGFGGAPMPRATVARLAGTLPDLALINCYGATETTSPATMSPFGAIRTHPDSVGRAVACADILVVDPQGREVAPGESGELLIGGPMTIPGYWENPEADRTGFIGGYWVSGDLGSKDADGFVRVLDRKKDMINRAGYKVYCIEVENVMSHHPSVVEAAVVGRPDPVLGERVHAFVCTGGRPADAEAIRAWCAGRLSDYKVPDAITFLDAPLPRNANGKVLKMALRDLLPD